MLIVLSVVTCDCCKLMNNRLDWAFRNSALEVGLPAFQLHMFAKCDAVPNEICSTCFVSGIHSLYLFLQRHSTHEDIRKSVRVDYWVANPARTSPGSVFELWISDGFRRTFSVPKICPRSIQATHACHSEVSNRCFGLWSPRPFVSIFRCRPHVSMFEKCNAVPKGDLFDMFVWGIHAFCEI